MEFGVVVLWWATYLVLVLTGWPLASRILPEVPDRGAALAASASLVVLAIPTLLVGQVSFDLGILVSVVILAALSVVGWRTWLEGPDEIPWREFGATLLVFTVAFGFMLVVRAAAPGVYPGGGEKFLDFGLLQSLLRAERLAPPDMWFAGEHIIYYYGGHMLAAVLATLNGTPGVWAKAPALSGYFAIEVTAVYGLAQAITARRLGTDAASGRSAWQTNVGIAVVVGLVSMWLFGVGATLVALPVVFGLFVLSLRPARRSGVLAAFVFGFASNLLTPVRLAANHLSRQTIGAVLANLGPERNLEPYVTPDTWNYWSASRVIPDTINEFPLFAYRNGDLHAHSMSPAFLLLLVGVLYAYHHTPPENRRRRLGLLASTVPITGVVLTVNTWSVPAALGLVALGVAGARTPIWTLWSRYADWRPNRALEEGSRAVSGVLVAGGAAVLAVALVWPFVVDVLLSGVGGRHPALFPTRSGLGPFVIVHGAFLVTGAGYLASRGTTRRRGRVLAIASIPVLMVVGWQLNLVGLALVGPLVVGAWWLLRTDRAGFEALLWTAGGGLVVIVEFAYLVDNAAPERFNTVFKIYYQVWTLWAVAMGVALSSFVGTARQVGPDWRPASFADVSSAVRRVAGPVAVVFLLVTTSMYGGLVLTNHVGGADEYSLDAMTYAETNHPGEAAAIEWLHDRPGQPTLVEMPCTAVYTWCNPASSLTGNPTILGWGHEAIYRGWEAFNGRQIVVSVLYDTEDPYSRAVLLRNYDVDYIYVGPREREAYETIDYSREPGIEVAYENSEVVIYRVDHASLTTEQ